MQYMNSTVFARVSISALVRFINLRGEKEGEKFCALFCIVLIFYCLIYIINMVKLASNRIS